MTKENKIIYDEVRAIYKTIKDGNDRLDEIRKVCKHEETKLVNYMWRVGSICPNTEVCKFCGEVIPKKIEYDPETFMPISSEGSYTINGWEDKINL